MLLRMLPVSAGGLSSAAGEAAARAVHPARWRLAAGPRRQLGHQGPGGAAEIRAPAMDQHDRNRDPGSGDAHGPQASHTQLFVDAALCIGHMDGPPVRCGSGGAPCSTTRYSPVRSFATEPTSAFDSPTAPTFAVWSAPASPAS